VVSNIGYAVLLLTSTVYIPSLPTQLGLLSHFGR